AGHVRSVARAAERRLAKGWKAQVGRGLTPALAGDGSPSRRSNRWKGGSCGKTAVTWGLTPITSSSYVRSRRLVPLPARDRQQSSAATTASSRAQRNRGCLTPLTLSVVKPQLRNLHRIAHHATHDAGLVVDAAGPPASQRML